MKNSIRKRGVEIQSVKIVSSTSTTGISREEKMVIEPRRNLDDGHTIVVR